MESHQEQMEQHNYAECYRCEKELFKDFLGICDDGYICIECNSEVENEREEMLNYAECYYCENLFPKDDLGVYTDVFICIDCNNDTKTEEKKLKYEWNNRKCIGRKGEECGEPCNSSSAEFCDDCLAQEIGYC